jgi:hypothetical protein
MRHLLAWPVALVAAVTTGLSVTVATPAPAAATATVAATVERDRQLRERITTLLPADYRARVAAVAEQQDTIDLRRLVARAIDPGDYECGPTALFDWLAASVDDWTEEDLQNVELVLGLNLAFLDQLLFPGPAGERYFGLDGEYTTTLQRSFRNLQRFWDIDGSEIELVPAHGDSLLQSARTARVLEVLLGLTPAEAAEAAAAIATIMNQPQYDYGDHPIFTFNAFAFTTLGEEIPGVGVPSDKIAMGDGMLEGFRAVGLGDVAPNAILGHEYGHHIQFDRELFEWPLPGPEESRHAELMADSFGAYHASHRRGSDLNWRRTRQLLKTFYNLGDCLFDNPAHHGTPNQRMRAADWANETADRARPPYRVLPTLTFARLFDRKLPDLVAPDAHETNLPGSSAAGGLSRRSDS